MGNKGLDGFGQIAERVYQAEAKYRPGLRRGSRVFREECLLVLARAAEVAGAPYRGRRFGLLKTGERVPVRIIQEAGALSAFRKYLDERNIPRREVIDTRTTHEKGGAVITAVPIAGFTWDDGREYESGKSTESRTKRSGVRNQITPAFGEGSSTPDPFKIWRDAPWSGQQFIARLCKLTSGSGWNVTVPAMPWGKQRQIIRRWRQLRGDVQGPISLLDPNAGELYRVPGTALTIALRWDLGLLGNRSLLDTTEATKAA